MRVLSLMVAVLVLVLLAADASAACGRRGGRLFNRGACGQAATAPACGGSAAPALYPFPVPQQMPAQYPASAACPTGRCPLVDTTPRGLIRTR